MPASDTQQAPAWIMVAGPNGAGKTTLARALRASPEIGLPAHYLNADELALERGLDTRAAQRLAEALRWESIRRGRSLLYETVMSHPSKLAELQAAARAGFAISVFFVATGDPQVNVERVALRVAAGGHDVPEERVRGRHRRSLALAPSALGFAAQAYVYDNSEWGTLSRQQLQAALAGTTLQPTVERPAPWVSTLIGRVNARAAELEALHRSPPGGAAPVMANLYDGSSEGTIVAGGEHYALQRDRDAGVLLHDLALLPEPVVAGQRWRIRYAEGVATLSRSGRRLRAVDPAAKPT